MPTVEEVMMNGYPLNGNGETYGPDVKEYLYSPDLILVCNDEGKYGYVRKTDMDWAPSSPEDLTTSNRTTRVLKMYLEDGVTVIGLFKFG